MKRLSHSELDVATLFSIGHTDAMIAMARGTSWRTVKYQREQVRIKLEIGGGREAMREALDRYRDRLAANETPARVAAPDSRQAASQA